MCLRFPAILQSAAERFKLGQSSHGLIGLFGVTPRQREWFRFRRVNGAALPGRKVHAE